MTAKTIRLLCGLLAVALPLVLAGCLFGPHRSMAPLPEETKAELAAKGLNVGAPLYVRVFKQESQMEVWLGNAQGTYTLFRTYPICKWSGTLGPKTATGDRQAPEGFYLVTARQMNPRSKYYLSFNLGYPNAYDRALGYTGSELMVHGGCRSVGCYAITDDAIQELFSLAREAFTAGQREFAVHAFPFRMTAENMALHDGHPWQGFWRNLKEGYDLFEAIRRPPVVAVKNRRYVFFADEADIPQEFRLQPASSDPQLPQLISGWRS